MNSNTDIKTDQDDDELLQWVTFKLEDETYGVNVMQVKEVLRYTEIAPVPGATSYIVGIINLRGSVVTVIDARLRFGLAQSELTDSTRIIVLEMHNQGQTHTIGILVDSVFEVVYLKKSEIEPTPNVGTEESSEFIQGVCSRGDELLILVDLNKLLTEDEKSQMEL